MSESAWVSVKDATVLAHRGKTVVYTWVKRGVVRSRRSATGVLEVHGLDVVQAEANVRRGRPEGTPTRQKR
ncbi:hypothetical protein [Frigoribacterium sp. VKM Ac-2530]|uniref:hypothetical protein n=1 Tax=Frigoribacterium sp. VKM Ac-2530 TaxID=2783822 RepID=UPI00188CCD47|nr:hypothetical protein [Frigoribacterium sp. VKM Ac-2530]MBF4578943.1 hypothetical protein [Frigoribacterium sp. VKM Ac-2530]